MKNPARMTSNGYAERPKALDLFCGAGGASMGMHRAGFDVTGVDILPQPRYPFQFVQADVMNSPLDLWEFDLLWASPPCQGYSVTRSLHKRDHPKLVEKVRALLKASGKHWIIENVPGAPLHNAVILCGSMFDGLKVYRHRLFECSMPITLPARRCDHSFSMPKSKGEYHTLDKQEFITCVGHNFQAKSGRIALGIDWMTRDEMAQSIPPAYSEFLGRQVLRILQSESAHAG